MEKLWFQSYQAGVPEEITCDPNASINSLVEEAVKQFPHHYAFENEGRLYTFREIFEKSTQFASYLSGVLRVQKGDRVLVMLPNLLQYPIALFAILRIGAVVVNVNPLSATRELDHVLQDSGAKVLIAFAHAGSVINALKNTYSLEHVIVTSIGDCLSRAKSFIYNMWVKFALNVEPIKFQHQTDFMEALKMGSTQSCPSISVLGKDLAFLQYTGGTTGTPKGAMITHLNMVSNIKQAVAWINPVITMGEEIIITALPLYHIFSLMANCLTFFSIGALNILVTNPRDLKHFIRILRKYPFTAITGVNTLFKALLHHPWIHKVSFKSLKISLAGGMALQKSVAEEWQQKTGQVLLEAYGLTEASPAICINPMNLSEYNGKIGLPISSTWVEIRDEKGTALGTSLPGELWVKGPQVMEGYWNQPDETQLVLKNGWLKTGDIASVDNQGFVQIFDRSKDLIIISGFNVYPNEVEDVLVQMPGIEEAAVIGIKRGENEVVRAYVVKSSLSMTEESIQAYCRTRLSAYKIPKEIVFKKSLPKSAVGKVLRRVLREER